MSEQIIDFGFDKDCTWAKVDGRCSVFLDTMCWIEMADESTDTACRVRDRLKALVAAGRVFCPLSWGILEELFKQSGDSRKATASLMEELSLNAIFVMRTELYQWEFSRSVRKFLGEPVGDSLRGLFAPPAAFVGSGPCLTWKANFSLGPEVQAKLKAYMKHNLSKIGVVELAEKKGAFKLDEKPPDYSQAARKLSEKFKGDRKKLFLEEAGNGFYLYVRPLLLRYPPQLMASWSAQFGPAEDEEAWFLKALAQLPALHNFIDLMVVADLQPARKDKFNDFMDNEIMVGPLAYASVFVSRDRAIRDVLRNRTNILNRTECQYCDSIDALEAWLNANVP